jgi:hypothetical protein
MVIITDPVFIKMSGMTIVKYGIDFIWIFMVEIIN